MPAQTDTTAEIHLNGEPRQVVAGSTVADVLEEMDLDPSEPKGIAVAVNDEVVQKGEWFARALTDGDRVEVITARQGG